MRQIKLGEKWTWDDYGVMLAPNVSLGEAKPKTEYVDIPYGNGSIDLSEALTNEISFEDREFSFQLVFPPDVRNWHEIRKKIANDCNGRKMKIIFPTYPDYYILGRVTVGKIDEDNSVATLEISGKAEPYLYKHDLTKVEGVIPASGEIALNLKNERLGAIPSFTINATSQLIFEGSTLNHSAGTFSFANIYLKQGDNLLTIKATAGTTYLITYQEGGL